MNRRILNVSAFLFLLFGFGASAAHAQYVPATMAAQHHSSGGGGGATNFAYVTGSVTGCTSSGGPTTNCVYSLHSNPVAGQLMVVEATFDTSSATTLTFSCTNNGSFSQAGVFVAGTGTLAGYSSGIFYKVLTSSGADTCTSTPNASSGQFWESVQYTFSGSFTGLDGAATITQTNSNGSNVATITAGGSTSGTSDLVVALAMNSNSGTTTTPGSGYTFRNDTAACAWNGSCSSVDFNGFTGAGYEDKVNVSATTPVATFNTIATSDAQLMGLVSFH